MAVGVGSQATKRQCSFPGCTRPVVGLGLCSAHWQQQHHGKPLTVVKARFLQKSLAERLWSRVKKLPGNGCWVWQGHKHTGGYGQLKYRGRLYFTHRVSWEIQHGPIPVGLQVLHACDNPPCVRHLFLGTQADNLSDMDRKGRRSPRPREFLMEHPELWFPSGESHPDAKLSSAQVVELKTLRKGGAKLRVLAERFQVRESTVSRICNGVRRAAG